MNRKSVCNSFLFLIYFIYQLTGLSKVAQCPDDPLWPRWPNLSFNGTLLMQFAVTENADGTAKYIFIFSC